MSLLKGGTEGERQRGFSVSFFHKGVDAIILKRDTLYTGRVLPAFDQSLRDHPQFRQSVVPYRKKRENAANGPAEAPDPFTSWYYEVPCHRNIGPSGWSGVSPLAISEADSGAYGVDPILDLYRAAKHSSDPNISYLVQKPKDPKESSPLNPPKTMGFMNLIMFDATKPPVTQAVVVSGGSLGVLKDSLNTERPARVQQIVDPNYPDYLYGDITSLDYGCVVKGKRGQTSQGGFEASILYCSDVVGTLTGYMQYPLPLSQDYTRHFLSQRYDFADTRNVTKVMDGQEIVDRLVADSFLPYEFLQSVLGRYWNVPPQKARATHFPGQSFNRPAVVYYMAGPNNQPVEVPEEQIIERLTTAGDTFMVFRSGDAAWTSPSALGFKPRTAALPPPPMAALPPPPMAAPTPPNMPGQEHVPTGGLLAVAGRPAPVFQGVGATTAPAPGMPPSPAPGMPPSPQGWQQPPQMQQPPAAPQTPPALPAAPAGWQQPQAPNPAAPGMPPSPQGWQQPPAAPQGWQQPPQPPQMQQPPAAPQGWQQPPAAPLGGPGFIPPTPATGAPLMPSTPPAQPLPAPPQSSQQAMAQPSQPPAVQASSPNPGTPGVVTNQWTPADEAEYTRLMNLMATTPQQSTSADHAALSSLAQRRQQVQ